MRARRHIPEVLNPEERVLLVHDLDLFQLQGAAVNSHPGVAPYDWSDVYYDYQNPGSNTSGTHGAFTFLTDPTNSAIDDVFTGGSTKDTNGLGQWRWEHAKASQAKTDISDAYAAAYTYTGAPTGNVNTGDTIL